MKYLLPAFLVMMLCAMSIKSHAQNTIPPSQFLDTLAAIAPHRPVMMRDSTGTNIFHGGLLKYKWEENETVLENWHTLYPSEVDNYIPAIRYYISHNTNTTLTGAEGEIYCDLKSQWVLFAHVLEIPVNDN